MSLLTDAQLSLYVFVVVVVVVVVVCVCVSFFFCIQQIAEETKDDASFNRFNFTVKKLDLDEAKLNQIDEVVTLYKIS